LLVVDGFVNGSNDGSRRGRWTFIVKSVWDSRSSLQHRFAIESVFADLVKCVEDAERREQAKHMSSIAWQFDNLVIQQIELQKGSH
jgi:hypothetical protein